MQVWMLAGALCAAGAWAVAAEPAPPICAVPPVQGGEPFPVDQLDHQTHCRLTAVINGYTTAGLVGPAQTPVPHTLYEYLLDRPPLIASLLERMGIVGYQFSDRNKNQYWVNDGEGTQGLLTLIYKDAAHRIYHIDGYHEGQTFPMVRAKAVVFMHLAPATSADNLPAVTTKFMAYTHLDDGLLAGLVRILRPLVGDAVTRKLTRGFDVTNRLGLFIAQDRDHVAREASMIPWLNSNDLQALIGLIYTVPERPPTPPVPPAPVVVSP
jgi:hypothetical protein